MKPSDHKTQRRQLMEKKYTITLEYCVPWNYIERAVRVADNILSHYQHVIKSFTFITGSKGAFEFKVNDELIYSKQTLQMRHAEPGEILALFQEIVGPDVPVYPQ